MEGDLRVMKHCWRSLYSKLCNVTNISEEEMKDELELYFEQFKHGLTDYDSPVDFWNFSMKKSGTSSEMENFLLKLIKILQLEPNHSLAVFLNYTLHELRQPHFVLANVILENEQSFLLSVWTFFSREKLFYLKCLHHLILTSNGMKYYAVIEEFLKKFSLTELYENVVKRFKRIVGFPPPSIDTHGEIAETLMPYWIKYNLQEQVQLLRLIVCLYPSVPFQFEMLQNHFDLLKLTLFGTHQYYSVLDSGSKINMQRIISFLMNFHILQLLKSGWKDDIYNGNEEIFRENGILINSGSFRIEKGPLIAAWILLKCHRLSVKNHMSNKEIASEYGCCNVDLWKFLLFLLQSDLFQESVDLFGMAAVISDEMITLSFNYFGMNIFQDENTLVSLVCCLARWTGFTCMPSSLKFLWFYYCNLFPYNMASFLQLANVIIDRQYYGSVDNIVFAINDLPYNVKNTHRRIKTIVFDGKHISEHPIQPLHYFPELTILAGTHVTYDYENDTLKLQNSIPIWIIIQNCLRGYIAGAQISNGADVVQCIKFCLTVLKYNTRFLTEMISCNEDVLLLLCGINLESVEMVNFEIVEACLDLSSVVILLSCRDVLRYYSSLKLLPDYTVDVKKDYTIFSLKYYVGSLLWNIIELEEEKFGTYSVLIAYLKFLRNLITVNQDEGWYIMGGVTLILNVLNKFEENVWHFKDAKDYYLIIWRSIQILNDIVTRGVNYVYSKNKYDALEDFNMQKQNLYVPSVYFIANNCVRMFLIETNQTLIQTIATMGETKLFEQVENCISWSTGSSAVIINTVNSALSFLYRCLVFKEIIEQRGIQVPRLSNDVIKNVYNPYAVFTYIRNYLSYPLKLLALKFLTQLAEEQIGCITFELDFSISHLRKEFLHSLYSDKFTIKYKVACLLFMAKCIQKQKVIASAIIDVEDIQKLIKLSTNKSGSDSLMSRITENKNNLFSFVIQELINIYNGDTVSEEMHFALLKIIFATWECLYHLKSFFLIAPAFWKCLFNPLTQSPNVSFRGYGLIMDISKLEIMKTDSLDQHLRTILQAFFDSEQFLIWTEHSLEIVDVPNTVETVFKSISVQPSSIAISWKEFLLVISARVKDVIKNPSVVARFLLDKLVKSIGSLKLDASLVYNVDMYFLFLNGWKEKCSSDWFKDLHLLCDMFEKLIEFNSYYPAASNLFNTLILISHKIFVYGKKHLTKVITDRQQVINKWFRFMTEEIYQATQSIVNKTVDNISLPLYISFMTDAIVTLKANMVDIILHTMKSVNIFNCLLDFIFTLNKNEETFELMSTVTKFLKMISIHCQINNKFMDVDKFVLDLLCMVTPPELEIHKDIAETTNFSTNNWKFYLYGDIIDIVTLLVGEIKPHTKVQVFHLLPKHLDFLNCLLSSTIDVTEEKCLKLIISCMALANFVSNNRNYWEALDMSAMGSLMKSIRNYTCSVVSRLMHPIKICCSIHNLNSPVELKQLLAESNVAGDMHLNIDKIRLVYDRLLLIAKMGICILSKFTVDCELIWDLMWFGWPMQYIDYMSCLPFKRSNLLYINLLPYLEWKEISLLISFIDQLQNASERQKCDIQLTIKDNIEKTTPIVLYVNSKTLIAQTTMYLASELSRIFLSESLPSKGKEILATEIYLYMQDFITNVKSPDGSHASGKLDSILERRKKLLWRFEKADEDDDIEDLTAKIVPPSHAIWTINIKNENLRNIILENPVTSTLNTQHSSQKKDRNFIFRRGIELNFDEFTHNEDKHSIANNDSVNNATLYCATRFVYKLLLRYKYE